MRSCAYNKYKYKYKYKYDTVQGPNPLHPTYDSLVSGDVSIIPATTFSINVSPYIFCTFRFYLNMGSQILCFNETSKIVLRPLSWPFLILPRES